MKGQPCKAGSGNNRQALRTRVRPITFTPRQRFVDTSRYALCDHGMPVHKLPDDLPPLRARMDLHGKPALLAPAIPQAGQGGLSPVQRQSDDECPGGTVRYLCSGENLIFLSFRSRSPGTLSETPSLPPGGGKHPRGSISLTPEFSLSSSTLTGDHAVGMREREEAKAICLTGER
jgi:hypothetical protein